MKEFWANCSYFWFVVMLAIVGFFCGAFKVEAQTVNSWSTNQVKINTCNGNGDCSDSSNYDGNHTFSGSVLDYPINFIQWRLKASSGLSKENYYTFTFGYKPTPDAIYPDGVPTFKKTGDYAVENISCNTSTNNGYYLWTCSFEPRESYSSDEYLYVRINFYDGYLTKIVSSMSGYKVMQGVSGTINDSTNTIINNNNNNTQEIINNNNNNTQAIIDSQTENQKVCSTKVIDKKSITQLGYALSITGNTVWGGGDTYGVTDYIDISNVTEIKSPEGGASGIRSCFYNSSKVAISCVEQVTVGVLTIPNDAFYFRATIRSNTNLPTFDIYYCKNGNQALDDTLKDDSIDSPDDMISDFEDMLPSNGTITQLIGLPIILYTKVLNSINGTCSQFNLGSLYNHDLIIPCINISTYLGSNVWSTIDIIISGAFVLVIARKMIKAFEGFTSMKEGDVIND